MILNIEGNLNRYYAQTLCLVYFPGAKFGEDEVEGDGVPVVGMFVEDRDDGIYSRVSIRLGERKSEADCFVEFSELFPRERVRKVASGHAMTLAAKDFFGYISPWGLLTGVRPAALLHDYACGVDPSPVLAEPEAVKCYGNSTTLEQDVTTVPQANQILLALCDSVAARLRADGRRCLCLTVTIRGSDFKNRSHQRRLPEPSDVTQELYDCAKSLFAEFWDGRPLRLLGVPLSDLTDGQTQQLSLFPDEKRDRARKLDQAVDQLRGKFGPAAISRGPLTPTTHRLHRKFTPKPPDSIEQ